MWTNTWARLLLIINLFSRKFVVVSLIIHTQNEAKAKRHFRSSGFKPVQLLIISDFQLIGFRPPKLFSISRTSYAVIRLAYG